MKEVYAISLYHYTLVYAINLPVTKTKITTLIIGANMLI